jgi:hypothetical protein
MKIKMKKLNGLQPHITTVNLNFLSLIFILVSEDIKMKIDDDDLEIDYAKCIQTWSPWTDSAAERNAICGTLPIGKSLIIELNGN